MSVAVRFDTVSIVFGEKPERALAVLDAGRSRSEAQAETGQIVGVHDCSLDVAQGEILVLMGLSGSGKSTLLRAVNGLAPVARGAVHVSDGSGMVNMSRADAATLRRMRLNRIAMVFQHFGLLPWRSVRDNVGLGLELGGMNGQARAAKVEEQLALVNLSDWAERKVGELSGGMQQRVGLARALATDAPILLMDEPFSALDPLIRTRLQDELLELQDRLHRTIIFVSHDLDEAFRIGNRIAILEDGRIVQCGTPREIFSKPANAHVADFVTHMNPLGVLRAADLLEAVSGTLPARLIAAETPLGEVMRALLEEGAALGVQRDGTLIGQVTQETVLRQLLDPRGGF
ncbi:MAG: choline ABC transporter ATP-binding protein [Tropicimonas sp.]|uniref:choline ABC transporter ATP-binding protein n=1 Tax=Tropicimonas sp. TaxID=2067044 RepID=UPI003A878FCF